MLKPKVDPKGFYRKVTEIIEDTELAKLENDELCREGLAALLELMGGKPEACASLPPAKEDDE